MNDSRKIFGITFTIVLIGIVGISIFFLNQKSDLPSKSESVVQDTLGAVTNESSLRIQVKEVEEGAAESVILLLAMNVSDSVRYLTPGIELFGKDEKGVNQACRATNDGSTTIAANQTVEIEVTCYHSESAGLGELYFQPNDSVMTIRIALP